MFMNRIAKWAAIGIFAIAAVPTVGMGRTRASLPSAAVTQTPATASPVGIKHTKKVSKKHTARHKRTVKASAKRSHKASAKKSTHKASHKKHVSHKKAAK